MSASVKTGYNKSVYDGFDRDVMITNLHSDITTKNNDIPMQGPFTEGWVGGHQSRHANISDGSDHVGTRGEAWRLLFAEHSSQDVLDGAFGFAGADYGSNYPDIESKAPTKH